jgi:hypothetical protein
MTKWRQLLIGATLTTKRLDLGCEKNPEDPSSFCGSLGSLRKPSERAIKREQRHQRN